MTTSFQTVCTTTPAQHLAVNGVPLANFGRVEQVWAGVFGMPELFGDPIHLPLRPGALHVPQVTGSREIEIGMLIHGANDKDEAGHNDRWRELARLVWSPMKPLLLQRTIVSSAGTEVQECSASLVNGLAPDYVTGRAMSRVVLRLINLDGYWYAPTDTVVTVAGDDEDGVVIDMPGDAQTRRMNITLGGMASGVQTLANTTNGCILSYTGSTTEEVDLDVFAFTAVTSEENLVKNVKHAGDVFWMRLEPGPNTLVLSGGGTATIRARATYL